MDNFFENILRDSKTAVPEAIRYSFSQNFPDALNTEWYINVHIFEAVFHENDLEKIAFFDYNGTLIETKVNILKTGLPYYILDAASSHGEIMNAIEITSIAKKRYEIILRDDKLTRYVYYFDEEGNLLNYSQL